MWFHCYLLFIPACEDKHNKNSSNDRVVNFRFCFFMASRHFQLHTEIGDCGSALRVSQGLMAHVNVGRAIQSLNFGCEQIYVSSSTLPQNAGKWTLKMIKIYMHINHWTITAVTLSVCTRFPYWEAIARCQKGQMTDHLQFSRVFFFSFAKILYETTLSKRVKLNKK